MAELVSNPSEMAADLAARDLRVRQEAAVNAFVDVSDEQSMKDFSAYLEGRPYMDAAGKVHDAANGQFTDPNSAYETDSKGRVINSAIESDTLADTNRYDPMSMSQLAKELAEAEVAGDKTKQEDVSEILEGRITAHLDKVRESGKSDATSQEVRDDSVLVDKDGNPYRSTAEGNVRARLNRIKEQEKARLEGEDTTADNKVEDKVVEAKTTTPPGESITIDNLKDMDKQQLNQLLNDKAKAAANALRTGSAQEKGQALAEIDEVLHAIAEKDNLTDEEVGRMRQSIGRYINQESKKELSDPDYDGPAKDGMEVELQTNGTDAEIQPDAEPITESYDATPETRWNRAKRWLRNRKNAIMLSPTTVTGRIGEKLRRGREESEVETQKRGKQALLIGAAALGAAGLVFALNRKGFDTNLDLWPFGDGDGNGSNKTGLANALDIDGTGNGNGSGGLSTTESTEAFWDQVANGDGITHTVGDLITARTSEVPSTQELKQLYDGNAAALNQLPGVIEMPDVYGGHGFSMPGITTEVSDELADELVKKFKTMRGL